MGAVATYFSGGDRAGRRDSSGLGQVWDTLTFGIEDAVDPQNDGKQASFDGGGSSEQLCGGCRGIEAARQGLRSVQKVEASASAQSQ